MNKKKEFRPDIWDVKPIPDDYLRPQDDVPYERMMLRIIQDYRRQRNSLKKAHIIIKRQNKELDSLRQYKATKADILRLERKLAEKNEKIEQLKNKDKKMKLIQKLRLEIEEKDKIIRELKGE